MVEIFGLRFAVRSGGVARLTLLLAAAATSGCATYIDHLRQANAYASAGNYAGAVGDMNALLGVSSGEQLPDQWSGDRPLAILERGSLHQALDRYTDSARDLSAADQQLELLDITSDPVGTLGSYLYSDSVKTYKTPPTERLSLNAINLLNFLAEGNLDGAAVEARRFQVMREYLSSLNITAAAPATLGTYLAGVVFEQRGEGDRALRYYDEALGGAGRLATLDAPIARLAVHFPYRGKNLKDVLARQGKARPPSASGEILVVLGLGRVPHREPARIPVGLAVSLAGSWISGNVDWLKYGATKVVVYPELVNTPSNLGSPQVLVDGQPVVDLDTLTDLGAAIRSEYEESKPKIIAAALTRMVARGAVAEGIRQAGKQQSDALGTALSLLFETTMVALDRPDTRSWTMLPERVLVARLPLAAGQHTVDVNFSGGVKKSVTVDVAILGVTAVVVTEPR